MITFDQSRFARATGAFFTHFGLPENTQPEFESLRELYRAFTNLPYENVSKIIRSHEPAENGIPLLRTPDEVRRATLSPGWAAPVFRLLNVSFLC